MRVTTFTVRPIAQVAIAACLLLTLLITAQRALAAETTEISDGIAAPAIDLVDLKGQTHKLSDYNGRVVLVNFWASWCPPCIEEMPAMTRLKRDMKDQPLDILALNVGEKKYRVYKFTRLVDFDLPVLLDTSQDTFNAWQVQTLPTTFLVDSNGTLRYRIRGNPDWDSEATRTLITRLLDEAASPSTKNSTASETSQ